MKSKIVLLLVLSVLVLFACMAEETTSTEAKILPNVSMDIDLDGDGENESLIWKIEKYDEFDNRAVIEVRKEDGMYSAWKSDRLINPQVYAKDVDEDGVVELFVSGDEMSCDYVTFCLNYIGESFQSVFFADASRGENTNAYYKGGYGALVSMEGNRVTLRGSQDMLGTYMSDRTFSMVNGCFELLDDGIWYVAATENDMERWEYQALTLKQDIQITFIAADGEEIGKLKAGEKMIVTAGDKTSRIWIQTQDKRCGILEIESDVDKGYGLIVNGVPENELFESIPYAG